MSSRAETLVEKAFMHLKPHQHRALKRALRNGEINEENVDDVLEGRITPPSMQKSKLKGLTGH